MVLVQNDTMIKQGHPANEYTTEHPDYNSAAKAVEEYLERDREQGVNDTYSIIEPDDITTVSIKWRSSIGETYGNVQVEFNGDAQQETVKQKIIELLESEWRTFGEDGDSIVIENLE